VLIDAEIGSESEVLRTLKDVEGVVETFTVYGVYDIVAKITAETLDTLKDIIVSRIRRLDKVLSTNTLLVVEDAAAT
jgi:DNA-binding Lrp family transcriptional regulator